MNGKRVLRWTGMGLCALGVIIGAKVPYFYLYSKIEGAHLVHKAEIVANGKPNQNIAQNKTSPVTVFPLLPVVNGNTDSLPDLSANSIIGIVQISAIHLTAPLLEGTTSNVLNAGVGHFQESANPGMPGTCVIAAHNATWFRHLDSLHTGDQIILQTKKAEYEYQVTGTRVVNTGDEVPNTAEPTIVLEACYPLDALYLTSKRYLVTGVLKAVHSKSMQPDSVPANSQNYVAQIPKETWQEGVTLADNQLPMGSLHFDGSPDLAYTESNAPLSAAYTMLQLYLTYVHASCSRNVSGLNQMLQSMALAKKSVPWLNAQIAQDPFFGLQPGDISYDSKFDITLQVAGNSLTGAMADTVVRVPNGQYRIEMRFSVHGIIFSIDSIDIHKVNV